MMPTGTRNLLMELLMGQVQAEQRGAEVEERTNMLPLVRYNDGTTGLGVPGAVYGPAQSAYNMLTTDRLNRALMGDDQAMQQSTRDSFDAASLAAVGGLTMPKPTNSLGMFGGRMAKTADHAALAKAEDMASRGAPREQIWDETGWFQGVDGKWRFEIDDSQAQFAEGRGVGLEGHATHDELKSAYPALGDDLKTDIYRPQQYGPVTHYMPRGSQSPQVVVRAIGPEAQRSASLHELQHAVQDIEFGIPDYRGLQPWQIKRLAGEVEARAVEARGGLTPEQRRARAPWLDYDVPESEQIVRFR